MDISFGLVSDADASVLHTLVRHEPSSWPIIDVVERHRGQSDNEAYYMNAPVRRNYVAAQVPMTHKEELIWNN